jgi:hypothetical protein
MDELSRRRLTHNEALFRAVNDEIDEHRASGAKRSYVCECVDPDCTQPIELTASEYEAVRASPDRFVVASDHVVPEIEHVVATAPDYTVVEKDVSV